MTSPNEPGHPRAGDRPSSTNGSAPGGDGGSVGSTASRATGQITDTGEVPPWQRGAAARAAQQPSAETRAEPARDSARGSAAPSPGVEARVQRFISGADTETEQQPRPAPRNEPRSEPRAEPRAEPRNEPVRSEAYASELPDLSGPVPRPPQRKTGGEARSSASAPTTRIQVASRPQPTSSGPVRASMQIRRVDPWTVLKVSLVLSVALFFVWMIAVAFLYLVLGGMGVWSKLNSNVGDLLTSASGSTGGELVSSGTIFGGAALIGLVNIVVLSAMATIGAFIYNLTTDLVGGVEVTLADRD